MTTQPGPNKNKAEANQTLAAHWLPSHVAHIWGLNEANDPRQTSVFLTPTVQMKTSRVPWLSFFTFYSHHWCGTLWKCVLKVFGILRPDKCCLSSINSWIFRQTVVMLLKCHFFTSLKLSNAERMISWPPRTRQTAASSSSTKAFVLQAQETHAQGIRMKHIRYHLTDEK